MFALLMLAAWTVQELPFVLATGETARKPLPATMPGGIAVLDADGDGLLDLFFPNGGELPQGRVMPGMLLRNRGGMKFEDITARAGLRANHYSFAAIAADYDNDGLPDLLICGLRGVTLYRNRGGSFEDATSRAGIDNQGRWSVGAAFFDLDNDGDLDLFLLNYVQWDPATEQVCLVNGKPDFCHPRHYAPQPNALFRNNGDGTFTDISESSGIAAHKGKGMGVAAADFDGDGLTDLFVTNDRVFHFFFHNQGGGKFAEAAFDFGVAVPQDGKPVSGMGADAQDYNNDGFPDLVYTALRDETFPLYRNHRKGFEESTSASRMSVLSRSMAGWGIVFADLDNDGWKDIAAARSDALSATGGKGPSAKEPPAWFRNSGDGKFIAGHGMEALPPDMYRGLAAADLDNDGCLDLVLTALHAKARILRNPCASPANWLKVHVPNSVARVRAGNQWREASTSAGYASSNAGPLHFGLGNQKQIEIEVFYRNGRRRTLSTPANRTITIEQ